MFQSTDEYRLPVSEVRVIDTTGSSITLTWQVCYKVQTALIIILSLYHSNSYCFVSAFMQKVVANDKISNTMIDKNEDKICQFLMIIIMRTTKIGKKNVR